MSRAASLPGAELVPGNRFFLKKPLVRGSFAAWGRTFSRKSTFFLKKPLVPGSFAAWGRTVSRKSTCFEEVTCPGQRRCLGQNFSRKNRKATCPGQLRCLAQNCLPENRHVSEKQRVPGSFAAWGRTFPEFNFCFEEATCLGQLRCLGQNLFYDTCAWAPNNVLGNPGIQAIGS